MSGTTTTAPPVYELDADAQQEIVALIAIDEDFLRETQGLIKPDYFTDVFDRAFVELAQEFYNKYGETPGKVAWGDMLRNAFINKRFRADQKDDVVAKYKAIRDLPIRNRKWVVDTVAEFAKQQSIENAMWDGVIMLKNTADPDRFTKIEDRLGKAFLVAAHTNDEDYDYFEKVVERTEHRLERIAGGPSKTGITTGVKELDDCLYHKGWGRKELSALMAGAKASKSFHLSFFAAHATMAGFNTLFVTLENSVEITATRIDAFMSGVKISEELVSPHAMEAGVNSKSATAGRGILKIRRRPAGSFTPSDLRRLLDEYKSKGIKFDLVVIDYTDLMIPNHITNDNITNSKSVLVDVRQIADDENLAMLSAFQSNREGHKSAVLRAENVAEDFNKIRIPDVVLGINRTEDERADQKARITFVAARNQPDSYTLFVSQDLDHGLAIASVDSVE